MTQRLHYLDSVRALAMYLGIILHATLPLLPWYEDYEMKEGYSLLLLFIHGFRMPLFMIISGFFTEMIIRRYGVSQFIDKRLKENRSTIHSFCPLDNNSIYHCIYDWRIFC